MKTVTLKMRVTGVNVSDEKTASVALSSVDSDNLFLNYFTMYVPIEEAPNLNDLVFITVTPQHQQV